MNVVKIIPRAKWGAAPPNKPPTPRPVTSLEGVVIHWFGNPKAAASHAGCDDLLRSVQRGHKAGEFSDIAYGHGVCPHGFAYELRGFGVQVGANGTSDANRRYGAVVYMAGTGDPLTDLGKAALTELVLLYRQKGAGRKVVPHGRITGSECPGPLVRRWIERREFDDPAFVIRYRNGIPYVEPRGTA